MAPAVHLAQINIARARAPLDDLQMAGFVARLDQINALAEASPGFVWRLKTDAGNATSLQPYDDDRILINLSVWESAEHLKQYVYRSVHTEVMRQRTAWFERFGEVYVALWWIPQGHLPTIAEAKERLRYLQSHGPSEFAFSFATPFAAPSTQAAAPGLAAPERAPAVAAASRPLANDEPKQSRTSRGQQPVR